MLIGQMMMNQDGQNKGVAEIHLDVASGVREVAKTNYRIAYQVIKVDRRIAMVVNAATWGVFTLGAWQVTGRKDVINIGVVFGVLSQMLTELHFGMKLLRMRRLCAISDTLAEEIADERETGRY